MAEDAFADPGERLRVEVVGRDPFNGALDRVLAGKTVAQRRVVVTHVSTPTLSPLPHVAFISSDEEERMATLLGTYCRKPVLTISDVDRFANRGGVIGLVEGGMFELIEDDHAVHFTVNRTALYEAHLQIGTERLYLAYPLFSAVSPCGALPAGTTVEEAGTPRSVLFGNETHADVKTTERYINSRTRPHLVQAR